MIHLLKETSPKGTITLCGLTVDRNETTAWWSMVDCPRCKPVVPNVKVLRRPKLL